jgi:hypothetical protein
MRPLTRMALGLAAPLLLVLALRVDGDETDTEAPTVSLDYELVPEGMSLQAVAVGRDGCLSRLMPASGITLDRIRVRRV